MQRLHGARDGTEKYNMSDGQGFRFIDLLHHLYKHVPGLYEYGMSPSSLRYLFQPPNKSARGARVFKGLINARRATRSNKFRPVSEGTHFGRAEQNLITEFLHSYGQLNVSGDDMNIIQVGRPAVSRYHQIVKFYPADEGPEYAVHDFPNAKYGIKLGGFMIRGGGKVLRGEKESRSTMDLLHLPY